jgi:GAF domain-containing protein
VTPPSGFDAKPSPFPGRRGGRGKHGARTRHALASIAVAASPDSGPGGPLLDAIRELLAIDAVEPLPSLVVRLYARLLGAEAAIVRMAESGGLVVAATWGGSEELKDSPRLEPGECLGGLAAATGRPQAAKDAARDPRITKGRRELLTRLGYRAVLAIPLSMDGRALGVLEAFSRRADAFTEEDVDTAVAYAAQASLALDNARRFAMESGRTAPGDLPGSVMPANIGELDATRFLRLLIDSTARLFEARAAIWLVVKESVLTERISSAGGATSEGRVFFGEGLAGCCAQSRQGLLVPDYPSWAQALPGAVTEGLRHAMAQPLLLRGRLVGVITAVRSGPQAVPFSETDLETLGRLALQASVAARNMALEEETGQRQREAEALAGIARSLNERVDVTGVCQQIVDCVRTLLPITAAVIAMPEPNGDMRGIVRSGDLNLKASDIVLPRGVGITGRAMLTGQPVSSGDVLNDPRVALPDRIRASVVTSGQRALLAMPLGPPGRPIGALTVTNRNALKFTEGERRLLEAFADQASLALENARLYEDAERHGKEAEALAQGARALTSMQDAMQVVSRIVESVPSLLPGCVHAAIAVPRAEGRLVAVAVGGPLSGVFQTGRSVIKGSIVNRVWLERRPSWTADLMAEPEPEEPELAERHHVFLQAGVRSYLAVPLSVRGHTVGVLGMAFSQPHAFMGDEIATGQTFANQAALALENARLYEEAERRRREAEVVAEISRTINASLDVDTILQQVVNGARMLCQSDIARIALRDPETGACVFRYWVNTLYEGYDSVRIRPGVRSLGGLVLQSRGPVRTADWMADPRFAKEWSTVIESEGIAAQMAVPIVIGEEIEGLLYVDNRSPRAFTDFDESALGLLAEHAAVAIRNARLFTTVQATGQRLQALSARLLEVQEAERRHLARELHDEVGQALTAVRMNLQMLRRQPETALSAGRLDESLGMVDHILRGVRQLSLDLRPSLLDDLGLAAALRWYVGAQAERSGIAGDVVTEDVPADLPAATATTCYRIAQEAVTNAIRHARATRITVTLGSTANQLEISVSDNGIGFDVTTARRRAIQGASAGLLGLEERVELAGGRSSIVSTPGQGTVLRAWLPLANPPLSAAHEAAEGVQ